MAKDAASSNRDGEAQDEVEFLLLHAVVDTGLQKNHGQRKIEPPTAVERAGDGTHVSLGGDAHADQRVHEVLVDSRHAVSAEGHRAAAKIVERGRGAQVRLPARGLAHDLVDGGGHRLPLGQEGRITRQAKADGNPPEGGGLD